MNPGGYPKDSKMIDLHCHLLPGVDDGASTFDEAVEMCYMAVKDGITHIVATPHCNFHYPFRPEENAKQITELQAAVGETPKLYLGCDFHLSYENIQSIHKDSRKFTINGKKYLLVEFEGHTIPQYMRQIFFEMISGGIIPIITHPDRNYVLCRHPEILYDWVNAGCLSQVTAQSLTVDFGKTAQKAAQVLMEHNLVHAIATDAHNLTSRPPRLFSCYQKVAEQHGESVAEELFHKNPQAILEGNDVVWSRQPIELRKPKRHNWFFRLLGGHQR